MELTSSPIQCRRARSVRVSHFLLRLSLDRVKTTGRLGKQTGEKSHAGPTRQLPSVSARTASVHLSLEAIALIAGLALHLLGRWRRWSRSGGLMLNLDYCLRQSGCTVQCCGLRDPGLLITAQATQEVKITHLKGRVAITGRVSGDHSLFICVFSHTRTHLRAIGARCSENT